ncbi:MAG: CHC2 zinc finger domain-containing protein [Desulfobacteraceae bacterium]|nr:CHC2 zinc finger domain-containing protein [Desulfobacteraceae bacterium]MDH3875425.1 CHC2 zinc finger domain-containing protein [Desulfobacteraceae bacterium]
MSNIGAIKESIDLASIVESAGVLLNRSGFGLCPFHDEKTASFKAYPDNHFKCFGCGEHGDVIDFVQKLYGLSFPDALKHLGIEQGRITPEIKRSIEQRKRKAELVGRFRLWVSRYLAHLGTMINRTDKLMKGIPPGDLERYAPLLHRLPVWKHHSDILLYGTDEEKHKLYKEAQQCRNRILT